MLYGYMGQFPKTLADVSYHTNNTQSLALLACQGQYTKLAFAYPTQLRRAFIVVSTPVVGISVALVRSTDQGDSITKRHHGTTEALTSSDRCLLGGSDTI